MGNELISSQPTNIEPINAERMNILICSNEENREHAESLKTNLDTWANVRMWGELFDGSMPVIKTLFTILGKFDISIVFLTSDVLKILDEKEMQTAKDSLLFELALSYMYIGRKNTIVVVETERKTERKEDLLTLLELEATTFIFHNFSESIEELIAKIELICNQNKIRWDTKNQSNLNVSNKVKEH
jgi:predicted nucleotide-binding protein